MQIFLSVEFTWTHWTLAKGCVLTFMYTSTNTWSCMLMSQQQPHVRHYNDVIMGTIASQITSLVIVYLTVYSDADQRKHQISASLAFVRGIHRGPVNSPHKGPVTRKKFPFDDVIMDRPASSLFSARHTDTIWHQFWLVLVELMACCLMEPCHYTQTNVDDKYQNPHEHFSAEILFQLII